MNRCENCGLPEGVLGDGEKVEIVRRAENGFNRDRRATVWVCSAECGAQTFGISKYGSKTSTWPVTLNQIRSQYRRKQNDERRTVQDPL